MQSFADSYACFYGDGSLQKRAGNVEWSQCSLLPPDELEDIGRALFLLIHNLCNFVILVVTHLMFPEDLNALPEFILVSECITLRDKSPFRKPEYLEKIRSSVEIDWN